MAFVYKYVDNNNNVVYVGKVKSDDYRGLVRRHKEHLYSDDWCTNNLKMYYFETKSHADADIYETFFISYYKQRYNLFNKAKLWGESDLDLECSIDWIEYTLRDPYIAAIVQNAPDVRGAEKIVTYKELHDKATSFTYAQEHSYTIKQIIAENQLEILQKYGVFVVDGAKGKDGRGIRIIKA